MTAIPDGLMRQGSFDSGGLRLSYRRFGKPGKMPVLLLHGLLYFSYDWTAVAEELARDREVIALDQRGFGDSDWSPSHDYQVADFARDGANLIEDRAWRQCVVAGHSMGGRNAACTALTIPERIAGLVLVDSPPYNAPHGSRRIGDQVAGVPDLFKSVDDALRYFPATPWSDQFDAVRRKRFEEYLKVVPGGYVVKRDPYFHRLFLNVKMTWPYHSYEYRTWPMGREFDVWDAWARLECPTYVLAGMGTGDIFSPEMADEVAQFASESNRRIELRRHIAHHNMPGRVPGLVVREIREMLVKIESD